MTRVTGEITITRPVQEVFDVVADERNEPEYNPAMLRVEKLTDGPVAGVRGSGPSGGTRLPMPEGQQGVVDRRAGELDLVSGPCDDCPRGADPFGQVVADGLEPCAVTAGDDELREGRGGERAERQIGLPEPPAPAEQRHERQRGVEELRGEPVGIAADRLRKATTHCSSGTSSSHMARSSRARALAAGWRWPNAKAAGSRSAKERVASGRRAAANRAPRPPYEWPTR
jgi:hypothetical protein